MQPSYLWATRDPRRARARYRDDARRTLRQYAALGLGRDLRRRTDVSRGSRVRRHSRRSRATHDANRAPIARSRVRATLADSTFWPEGMDFDPRTRRFYVASVRHRTIAEIGADGTSRELMARDRSRSRRDARRSRRHGARRSLGDDVGRSAVAERYAAGDSAIAALLRIRISDGTIEQRWDLPPIPGGHMLGDLAVGPTGDVFVTDSNDPVLYRLRPDADTLEAVRSPLFRSLQGLAPSPDGTALYPRRLLARPAARRSRDERGDAARRRARTRRRLAATESPGIAARSSRSRTESRPRASCASCSTPSGKRIARAELIDRNCADRRRADHRRGGRRRVRLRREQPVGEVRRRGPTHPGKPLTAPILLAVRSPLSLAVARTSSPR